MPRSGGTAGKLGDLYEVLWRNEQVLDIIEGRLWSITAEAIGEESVGVEFHIVTHEGTYQFHSVKRQKLGNNWSLANLCQKLAKGSDRSILGDLLSKRRGWPNCDLYFVSSTGANELRELTERAKQADLLEHFISGLSKELREGFNKYIVPLCNNSPEDAFAALTHLHVRLRDHESLVDSNDRRIQSLFYRLGGERLICGDMRRLLGELITTNLGRTHTTTSLREFLRELKVGFREWKIDTNTCELVSKINRRFRTFAERELINGQPIERELVREIGSKLLSEEHNGAILVAPGGFGKSCTLLQCVLQLESNEVPYICLRLDSLNPCKSTKQIGNQLDLQDSPVHVLAAIADTKSCILIVDQLDAISMVSGRNPDMWDVFDDMMKEVKQYPNMKVLLACREFDLDHDNRLRTLSSSDSKYARLTLQKLSVEEVNHAIQQAGFRTLELSESSLEILRTPFHLSLFLQGAVEDGFTTLDQLYDRYWKRKRQNLKHRLGREPFWNQVIDALTFQMSSRQLLFAQMAIADSWAEDASAMVSEHVLRHDPEQRQYMFFHESFFDYAFARRFCEKDQDILELLTSSEQHLFIRAQVRQILAYRRENDFSQYIKDLSAIISSNKVRWHVKKLVAANLRNIESPRPIEFESIEGLLSNSSLSGSLLLALYNHIGWFDCLNSIGVFERWLASEDGGLIDRTFWFFDAPRLHEQRSSEIAKLIAPYVSFRGEWSDRIKKVMLWGRPNLSDEMRSVFFDLLDRGVFDQGNDQKIGDFWGHLYTTGQEDPQFIIDVLERWFRRTLKLVGNDTLNFFAHFPNNRSHEGALLVVNAAVSQPEYFVGRILPLFIIAVKDSTKEIHSEVYSQIWFSFSNNGDPYDLKEAILLGLRRSMKILAKANPATFRFHANSIVCFPHRVFAYILLTAWAENPEEFADECCSYFINDPRRLNIGITSYVGRVEGHGESSISRRALQAITHYCSDGLHAQLEESIMGYASEYERGIPQWRGGPQLLRLRSLSANRISQRTRFRIEELERKFPTLSFKMVPEDQMLALTYAGSPLAEEVCEKMSNSQWISAMRKHTNDGNQFRGGATELSRVLIKLVRKNRHRFAELVEQIPHEVEADYFSAILTGLYTMDEKLEKEEKARESQVISSISSAVFLKVIERIFQHPSKLLARPILECIRFLSDRPIPLKLMEIVCHYAINHEDPASDSNDTPNRADVPSRLHLRGNGTVRGHAAETIGALLFQDSGRFGDLKIAIESCVQDPNLSVRCCSIYALLPILNFDRDYAVNWFLRCCDQSIELCATHQYDEFVHFAIETHYPDIRHLLFHCLDSGNDEAASMAARQVAYASLLEVSDANDIELVLCGTSHIRASAVAVFARNIDNDSVRSVCINQLGRFFEDESSEVRERLSTAFSILSDSTLLLEQEFILKYIESSSFLENPESLLDRLVSSSRELPDVICSAVTRLVDSMEKESNDSVQRSRRCLDDLATLIVRQYEQAKSEVMKVQCLNLIDRLEAQGVYKLGYELGRLDR